MCIDEISVFGRILHILRNEGMQDQETVSLMQSSSNFTCSYDHMFELARRFDTGMQI